jgi:hypothetical protein
VLAANRAVAPVLYAGAADALLRPPVNVLRLALHPEGMAPRIANHAEWRSALLAYLGQQVAAGGDPELAALLAELRGYPGPPAPAAAAEGRLAAGVPPVFVPLVLASDAGTLSLLSTVTVFAAPADVTLAELVVECFFPADEATADRLRALAPRGGAPPASTAGPR